MFDRMIVTETETTVTKSRRGYFVVSALAVGIAAFIGVVVSIFASDFSLGAKDFEMTTLLAPVEIAPVEPELPKPQMRPQAASPSKNKLPTRTDHIQNMVETPRDVPAISTKPSTAKARPEFGKYEIGRLNSDPATAGTSGRETTGTGTAPTGGGLSETAVAEVKPVTPPPPPPPVVKEPVRVPPVQSKGVINGMATSLPRPDYPPAAKAVRAQGSVNVRVLIDENGRVISADAVNGHPLLQHAAEEAARSARFTPTKLSNTPVKVRGTIVYNFNLG